MLIPHWNVPKNIQAFTQLSRDPPHAFPFPLHQVHGTRVVTLPYTQNTPPEADAAYTRTSNTLASIRTADCLPILLTNATGNEVAAIHAGWRGLAAGIIEKTFAQLQSPAQDCSIWIGPAICGRCFEIGPEVRHAFITKNARFASAFRPHFADRWLGNLPLLAEMILTQLGVEQIYQSQICSMEDLRCNSYRREKATNQRMVTGILFTDSSLQSKS